MAKKEKKKKGKRMKQKKQGRVKKVEIGTHNDVSSHELDIIAGKSNFICANNSKTLEITSFTKGDI